MLPVSENPSSLAVWLTSADQTFLFQRQADGLRFADETKDFPVITVDTERKYQLIEGFGFSLTGGSAMLISRLPAADRSTLLRELFLPDGDGIGVSFLRLSIGASDLSERCFSYDDRPDGQSDPELIHFDIEAGDGEVIPLLQEILAINPGIKIMSTAWSAPTWMKTNQGLVGGKLRADCYAVYAAYLVKYLQAMRDRGVTIHAITPQNEPLNQKNEPSMIMEAGEQAEFIKNHLGPALSAAGLADVELFCWDHNCDKWGRSISGRAFDLASRAWRKATSQTRTKCRAHHHLDEYPSSRRWNTRSGLRVCRSCGCRDNTKRGCGVPTIVDG